MSAREAMAEKNLKDEWVLKPPVRNGILVYRPDPASGKLVELLPQPWAKKMNLGIGTKRYHPGSETGSSGEMLRECLQRQIGSTSQISKSGTISISRMRRAAQRKSSSQRSYMPLLRTWS